MNKKDALKLKKKLEKTYRKNKHRLYVAPIELLSSNATHYGIYSWSLSNDNDYPFVTRDYLFDIANLEYFNYKEKVTVRTYFSQQGQHAFRECKDRENVAIASNMPLYMEEPMGEWKWRRFLLKKFTPITKDDILNCTSYFRNQILDARLLFNLEVCPVNVTGDCSMECD